MSAGLKRATLRALAQAKIDDAHLLFQKQRYSNAYYLAGYSIELSLKACIASQFVVDTIPDKSFVVDIYAGHDLKKLVKLAGLSTKLLKQSTSDVDFAANWALVAQWTEASRYGTTDSITAQAFFDAIMDHKSGVLQWIKKFW
jgi:hypothetical protein